MTADYRVAISTPAGALKHRLTDFNRLSVLNAVNTMGVAEIGLPGDHKAIVDLAHMTQVAIWRRDEENGIPWYRIFDGFYLDPKYTGAGSVEELTLKCYDLKYLLFIRHVYYHANMENLSKFYASYPNQIAHLLAYYNCAGGSTTANGRWIGGAIAGFSEGSNASNYGSTMEYACFGKNVLEAIRELAGLGGFYFDVVRTDVAEWEFETYSLLGTDRTADIRFTLETGVMFDATYQRGVSAEKTVVAVGGQGQNEDRNVRIMTGDNYVALDQSNPHHVETFHNGSGQASTDDALDAIGEQRALELKAVDKLTYKVNQTPSLALDRDYFLGDLVEAENPYSGTVVDQLVSAVAYSIDPAGNEKIEVDMVGV